MSKTDQVSQTTKASIIGSGDR